MLRALWKFIRRVIGIGYVQVERKYLRYLQDLIKRK